MPLRPKKILGELPVGAESHIPINVSVCVSALLLLDCYYTGTSLPGDHSAFIFSVFTSETFQIMFKCKVTTWLELLLMTVYKKGLFLKISALKQTAGIIC